jgi:SM-20-related protein
MTKMSDSSAAALLPRPSEASVSVEDKFQFLARFGADGVGHSGRALLDHLKATADMLAAWGEEAAVCDAGLFHSVYGTETFRRAILSVDRRAELAAVIGQRAERLAHLFGAMTKRSFFLAVSPRGPGELTLLDGRQEPVARSELKDLAHIFAANWLEQFPRMPARQRADSGGNLRPLMTWLNPPAQKALADTYGFSATPSPAPRRPTPPRSGEVRTVDDFVPAELRLQLSGLMDRNIWRYGWRANTTQVTHGFWHSHFGGGDENSLDNCEADLLDRPLIEPVVTLWKLIREQILGDHVPVRVYANGHTYGGDGHMHTDSAQPNYFTTIYYAHPAWEANWAGETVFFDQAGKDVIRSVFPTPGRLAIFPGDIPHAARAPSRDCPALRSVLVFKSRARNGHDAPSLL